MFIRFLDYVLHTLCGERCCGHVLFGFGLGMVEWASWPVTALALIGGFCGMVAHYLSPLIKEAA